MEPFPNIIFLKELCSVLISLMLLSLQMYTLQASNTITDKLALSHFKSLIFEDPTGALASWNSSLHVCEWQGVSCSDLKHPYRVTSLDLSSLNLTGTISSYLSSITFLRSISLPNNRFHGEIPLAFGNLSTLQHLNLTMNSLDGEIPYTLSHCLELRNISVKNNMLFGGIPSQLGSLPKLAILSLASNNLTGSIPSSLTNLSSLMYLDLARNNLSGRIPQALERLTSLILLTIFGNTLSGEIPASIANLTSLTGFDVSHNNLSGGIPASIGELRLLTYLDLSSNDLSGRIPSSIYNLSNLYHFAVASNKFFGTLPSDLGPSLPNVQWLDMYDNQFTGPIPPSLTNASRLALVQFHQNKFNGTIPRNLGTLRDLYWLALSNNQLETRSPDGLSFLTDLTNCSSLQTLEISGNKLGGMLPSSIVNFSTSLRWLLLGNNQIYGSIPRGIGNLVGLVMLSLGPNLLTGSIPATIGQLLHLHTLDLLANKLSGRIPSTLGNITQLNRLFLAPNQLSGSIPAELGNCHNLEYLDISHNQLTGTIPKEVVSISSLSAYLRMSNNFLFGPLPSQIGTLINLNELDVSNNKLSGEMPSTLGDCLVMEKLRMERNFFQGNIPSSWSNIKGLQALDVSQNNLSGEIPEFLDRLQFLQLLNLSFNNFEGEVPRGGIFAKASAFSILGNKNLCGGISKLQLQPCPTNDSKKKNKSRILIVVIPLASVIMCFITLICLCAIYVWVQKIRKKSPSLASLKNHYMQISYHQLYKATDGFSLETLIGMGGSSSVHKGTLDDGDERFVAVKIFNLRKVGASKSFINECEALRSIRHRNILKILTLCSSIDSRGNDFKALVFKFMSNGSLEKWLHPEAFQNHQTGNLSLTQRINIAIDVASALEYLHCNAEMPIVHCDLKPSNVLLDDDMTARVCDFGLARFINQSSINQTSSISIRGSIGYVAPEYAVGVEVSTQGDVYSYGILLLELFTGKRPTDDALREGLNIQKYVDTAFPRQVMDIVDPQLILQEEEARHNTPSTSTSNVMEPVQECLISVIDIGLRCSKESPRDRMKMENVVKEMHAIRKGFLESFDHGNRRNNQETR